MTKMEIMIAFDISAVEDEKLERLDGILREKIYKCDEEEYSELCESMEEKGFYGARIFPLCAKSDDEKDLNKAVTWILNNSEVLKGINDELEVKIQLVIKFLVQEDLSSILGFFADCPLKLVFSSNDFETLKEHNIDLKISAEYFDPIDDVDTGNNDSEDDFDSFVSFDKVDDTEFAEGIDVNNQDFTIKSGMLTEYKGRGETVVIPDGVTGIGYEAFAECKTIKDIVIPDSVKVIEAWAFSGCESLTSVNLPNEISGIENFTFSYCDGLDSFVVPDTVTRIGYCAFVNCTNLSDITIPKSVTSIDNEAFMFCVKLTIHAPAGSYAENYAKEHNIPFVAI